MAILNECWSTQERESPQPPFFKGGRRVSGREIELNRSRFHYSERVAISRLIQDGHYMRGRLVGRIEDGSYLYIAR